MRLCHHHRCTPAELRAWPLPVYLAALKVLDAEAKQHG